MSVALTKHLALDHLVHVGLLGEGGEGNRLAITTVDRRNRCVLVAREDGTGFVVKGAGGAGVPSHLDVEAAVIEHLWLVDPERAAVSVPRLLSCDRNGDVIVTDLLTNARDVREHHLRSGRFPVWIGRAIGEALSWVHGAPVAGLAGSLDGVEPPFAVRLHRPTLDDLARMGPANVRLVTIVQHAARLRLALEDLRSRWSGASLVHNDIRFDNLLVDARRGRHALRLVDWEMATIGDPAADVGGALAGYLEAWTLSFPIASPDALDRAARAQRHAVDSIHPAVRALWESYRMGSGLDGDAAVGFLDRSILFSAARLLQSAYERAMGAEDLPAHLILLVQVADNIVARPRDAALHLLGLHGEPSFER